MAGVAFATFTLFGSAVQDGGVIKTISDLSDNPGNTANDFGGVSFDTANGMFISGLTNLSTDFNVTDDDCAGGSPRFQIRVDFDNDDAISAGDKNVFVYLGPHPNYTGCTPNFWESSGDLRTSSDPIWDTSQVGGTFYDTYANASTLTATNEILRISLVTDAGWAFGDSEQEVWFDNTNINGTTYSYSTANDCKKGGWMDMEDADGNSFKNQGDCVSYFATGGKNPGAGE